MRYVPSKRVKNAHRKSGSKLSLKEFASQHTDSKAVRAWARNKRWHPWVAIAIGVSAFVLGLLTGCGALEYDEDPATTSENLVIYDAPEDCRFPDCRNPHEVPLKRTSDEKIQSAIKANPPELPMMGRRGIKPKPKNRAARGKGTPGSRNTKMDRRRRSRERRDRDKRRSNLANHDRRCYAHYAACERAALMTVEPIRASLACDSCNRHCMMRGPSKVAPPRRGGSRRVKDPWPHKLERYRFGCDYWTWVPRRDASDPLPLP